MSYYRILFYAENGDVSKKPELNTLRFDQDITVLSKQKYVQNFSFFCPANEKRLKSAGFPDFSEFFFLHGQLLPPYSICGSTLILGGIKKNQKAKYSCGS